MKLAECQAIENIIKKHFYIIGQAAAAAISITYILFSLFHLLIVATAGERERQTAQDHLHFSIENMYNMVCECDSRPLMRLEI